MFTSIEQFLDEIEKLKQKYNENGPVFSGKTEIFSEISQSLVSKAADFLTMSSKKESDITLRKLKERVEELERDKTEKKLEWANDKRILE